MMNCNDEHLKHGHQNQVRWKIKSANIKVIVVEMTHVFCG